MPEVLSNLNSSGFLPTSDSGADAKILVIDDEAGIRESLEVLLTLEGYTVEMAVDGEAGLARLEQNSYDLVLLDLSLPASRDSNCCRRFTSAIPSCRW